MRRLQKQEFKGSLVKIVDEPFVEEVAKELHCLPSYFAGGNDHIVDALRKLKESKK